MGNGAIERAKVKVRRMGLDGAAGNLAYCAALEAELAEAEAVLGEVTLYARKLIRDADPDLRRTGADVLDIIAMLGPDPEEG